MVEENTPSQKFDQANRNFKKVYRGRFNKPLGSKYKYLHNWTLQKSKYLLDDEKCYNGNKKVYSRGAIVNVDFGVNVGTELSGNHFAIILNKKDTKKNDKLTVVPLTSHRHSHTIQLDNTIRYSSILELKKSITTIMVTYYAVLYLQYDALKAIEQAPNQTPEEMFYTTFPKGEIYKENISNDDIVEYSIDAITDKKSAISFLKNYTNLYVTDTNPISQTVIIRLTSTLNQLNIVFDKYSQYDKTTYAKAADITTISKARLRKINGYDPIGDIKVSNSVLNSIDYELKSLFLHL